MSSTIEPGGHLQPEALNAFVDGELADIEATEVQKHLENCHACALRVLSATQLKTATGRAKERFTPPGDALARLTAGLKAEVSKAASPLKPEPLPIRPTSKRPVTPWVALAASVLVMVALAGWWNVRTSSTLSAELLDAHLATLANGAVPEVISTDRHTVKPWFQGRLPFSFNLPEANTLPAETTLRGADLVYIEGKPTALLLFTIRKHEVSVFVSERSGGLVVDPRGVRSGFALRSIDTADLRFIGVSDVTPGDVNQLLLSLAKVQ